MQQTEVAFKQLLGSGEVARAFMDELCGFAASTPFEFPELTRAAQKLIGVGTAAKDVIPYMTVNVDAVAAFGSGAGEVDRVTTALVQLQNQCTISAEETLQLADANIPAWQALAEATAISTAQLRDSPQRDCCLPLGASTSRLNWRQSLRNPAYSSVEQRRLDMSALVDTRSAAARFTPGAAIGNHPRA